MAAGNIVQKKGEANDDSILALKAENLANHIFNLLYFYV